VTKAVLAAASDLVAQFARRAAHETGDFLDRAFDSEAVGMIE